MPKNYCEKCGNSEANNIINIHETTGHFHLRVCNDCLESYKIKKQEKKKSSFDNLLNQIKNEHK